MIKKCLIRGLGLLLVINGCAGLEVGGDFSSGRRALMSGDSAMALTYFTRAAQRDPNYVAPFSSFRESIWTYLGRAQYQSGKLAEAKSSFEKALSQVPGDSVAKLYLGLTNVRLQSTQKATNPFTLQDISFALREKSSRSGSRILPVSGALILISQRNQRTSSERPARMTFCWIRSRKFAPRR